MLQTIYIKNYILIKELYLKPDQSFNVLTGETGSGKSMITKALGHLLGQRFSSKHFYDKNQKCIIEVEFDLQHYNLHPFFEAQNLDYKRLTVIRREFTAPTKSRMFINDSPTTLALAKLLTKRLLFIYSQDSVRLIGDKIFQIKVVDLLADNQDLITQYKTAFQNYQKADKHHIDLCQQEQKLKLNFDLYTYQLDELKKLPLDTLELTSLTDKVKQFENKTFIQTILQKIYSQLSDNEPSVEHLLGDILDNLKTIIDFGNTFELLNDRINGLLIEVRDIECELDLLRQNNDQADNLEILRDQLDEVQRLLVKHRVSNLKDLIMIRDHLEQVVQQTISLENKIKKALERKRKAEQTIHRLASKLTRKRTQALPALENQIQNLARHLGMPDITFQIRMRPSDFHDYGAENMDYYFSANKGLSPDLLTKMASGGECNRLMLILQYLIAAHTQLPCLIMDEIDTGTSGLIATQVANMLKDMATKHQIIVITHQAQVAAKGDKHYLVFKTERDNRVTSITKLIEGQDRLEQIAEMIAGSKSKQGALQNAKELLEET